jgi:benzoate/toluate 1,2-dioxygenase beta subunit/2,4,5-trichlorophenoxyacetic acid oxygenase 2
MSDVASSQIAAHVLSQEALALDMQDWDAWLDLYPEALEYWVPAWRNENELISNVKREVSLIYHTHRRELVDRVLRIRTRKSVTALPLPRTTHLITNVLAHAVDSADLLRGTAAWTVHEYDPRLKKSHTHFGRYEFDLHAGAGQWKIARKKIILMNDLIPTVMDFYNL